jgi:hypothetical protein
MGDAGLTFSLGGLLTGLVLSLRSLFAREPPILLREQVAQALSIEARQRPLLATVGSIPQPASASTVYHVRKRWHKGLLAAAAVPLVGVFVAFAVHLVHTTRSSPSSSRGSSVPVAVFNASNTPGAAHRLADTLKGDHIHISQIGDINANLGSGVYVLYPPGAQTQARRLARLIPSLSPTVEPIQQQVQNTVGKHNEIVVILH